MQTFTPFHLLLLPSYKQLLFFVYTLRFAFIFRLNYFYTKLYAVRYPLLRHFLSGRRNKVQSVNQPRKHKTMISAGTATKKEEK